jgi:PadR family transcriptional regulator, regulatory protein PadR
MHHLSVVEMRKRTIASELIPGTLEMLILKTLTRGPAHGYAIARHLEQRSAEVLQVGESSLYPALQRLLVNEWVQAEWGETDTGRRARFYRITAAGRKRLAAETAGFEKVIGAIAAIMQAG